MSLTLYDRDPIEHKFLRSYDFGAFGPRVRSARLKAWVLAQQFARYTWLSKEIWERIFWEAINSLTGRAAYLIHAPLYYARNEYNEEKQWLRRIWHMQYATRGGRRRSPRLNSSTLRDNYPEWPPARIAMYFRSVSRLLRSQITYGPGFNDEVSQFVAGPTMDLPFGTAPG